MRSCSRPGPLQLCPELPNCRPLYLKTVQGGLFFGSWDCRKAASSSSGRYGPTLGTAWLHNLGGEAVDVGVTRAQEQCCISDCSSGSATDPAHRRLRITEDKLNSLLVTQQELRKREDVLFRLNMKQHDELKRAHERVACAVRSEVTLLLSQSAPRHALHAHSCICSYTTDLPTLL